MNEGALRRGLVLAGAASVVLALLAVGTCRLAEHALKEFAGEESVTLVPFVRERRRSPCPTEVRRGMAVSLVGLRSARVEELLGELHSVMEAADGPFMTESFADIAWEVAPPEHDEYRSAVLKVHSRGNVVSDVQYEAWHG